jgi:hypothetical protein
MPMNREADANIAGTDLPVVWRVNRLYLDFFLFLDDLERGADSWQAYCERYLRKHENILRSYWQQVFGLPDAQWKARVELVQPSHYAQLRELVQQADLPALVREALGRCLAVPPRSEAPPVSLLVGFFSPEAFLFRVEAEWHIGIGLERYRDFQLLPVFIAHEYGHWLRRSHVERNDTVAEKLVAEGIAVAFSRSAYPEKLLAAHLGVSPGRLRWWQDHASLLWQRLMPHLESRSESVAREWFACPAGESEGACPERSRGEHVFARAAGYLGYSAVSAYAASKGLSATDSEIISADAQQIVRKPSSGKGRAR